MSSKRKSSVFSWFTIIFSVLLIGLPALCSHLEKKKAASYLKNYQEKEYVLQFSKDFKPGLNMVDDMGISIVIAVDCSGSMVDYPANGNKEKYKIASESLTEIMTFLEGFYYDSIKKKDNFILKVGLIKFNDDPSVLFDLTAMTPGSFKSLKEITSNVDNFKPEHKTAIGQTLELGTDILAQAGTIFKSLIIITDGENTTGVPPEDVLKAIVDNKNNKTKDDFPVITSNVLVSFVGFDVNRDLFTGLSNIGARVTSADNKNELNEALKNIFIADISKLEAK